MAFSGMLYRVVLARTDVSEELSASIIRVTRIGELETLAVTSSLILVTIMIETLHSSETSVLIKATWRNIQEGGILHSHCCENLKSHSSLLMNTYCPKNISCIFK
jgi:hypothetical protein